MDAPTATMSTAPHVRRSFTHQSSKIANATTIGMMAGARWNANPANAPSASDAAADGGCRDCHRPAHHAISTPSARAACASFDM